MTEYSRNTGQTKRSWTLRTNPLGASHHCLGHKEIFLWLSARLKPLVWVSEPQLWETLVCKETAAAHLGPLAHQVNAWVLLDTLNTREYVLLWLNQWKFQGHPLAATQCYAHVSTSHVTPWITSWINFSYASSAGELLGVWSMATCKYVL